MRYCRSSRSSTPSAHQCAAIRRAGFTLIEVIVGLVLMATVLVSALLAYSAHRRQSAAASAKLAAVEIADQWLHVLSQSREGIPAFGRGRVPQHEGWYWQTRMVGTATPAQVPVQVIRLEIARRTPENRLRVWAHVDVVKAVSP